MRNTDTQPKTRAGIDGRHDGRRRWRFCPDPCHRRRVRAGTHR